MFRFLMVWAGGRRHGVPLFFRSDTTGERAGGCIACVVRGIQLFQLTMYFVGTGVLPRELPSRRRDHGDNDDDQTDGQKSNLTKLLRT